MLDSIYGREELWPEPQSTALGRSIFRYTTAAPASVGAHCRRGFVAALLDRLQDGVPQPLSVASGHLREANLSSAVRRRSPCRHLIAPDHPWRLCQRCALLEDWLAIR